MKKKTLLCPSPVLFQPVTAGWLSLDQDNGEQRKPTNGSLSFRSWVGLGARGKVCPGKLRQEKVSVGSARPWTEGNPSMLNLWIEHLYVPSWGFSDLKFPLPPTPPKRVEKFMFFWLMHLETRHEKAFWGVLQVLSALFCVWEESSD